jgi:hypothetical protein
MHELVLTHEFCRSADTVIATFVMDRDRFESAMSEPDAP